MTASSRSTTTRPGPRPRTFTDSYFLVYNTDAKSGAAADKVVSWVNLTDDAAAATKVATAIAGKQFARVEQFAWWKEEANERQRVGTRHAVRRTPRCRSSRTPTTWPPTVAGA